jgi:hypothetical protein
MKPATSTPKNGHCKSYFKHGSLSVCCSMRVGEKAHSLSAKTRADYRAVGSPLQSLTRNAGSRWS